MPLPPIRKPPPGTQLNRNHPLAQRMVGCYVFNEQSGTAIADAVSGVRAIALADGPVPPIINAGDPYGGGATFQGGGSNPPNSLYSVSLDATLMNNIMQGPASLFARFKLSSTIGGGFVSKTDPVFGLTPGWIFGYVASDNSTIGLSIGFSVSQMFSAITPPSAAAWHNLLVVFDGSLTAANVKFYLDGVLTVHAGDTNGSGSAPDDTANRLQFGHHFTFGFNDFSGQLSTILIWKNRQLTQQDALTLQGDPWTYMRPAPNPLLFIPKTKSGVLTASMANFAGALVKSTSHSISASMSSFAGALTTLHSRPKALTASMANFAGSLIAAKAKIGSLTASMLQFSGSLVKSDRKTLTASMASFAGSLVTVHAATLKSLAATMSSFAGALVRQPTYPLTASMFGFQGALALAVQHGGVPSTCIPAACDIIPTIISHVEVCENPGS